jgi:diamine N-acetyltransferase
MKEVLIRKGTLEDVMALNELGRTTFYDTFAAQNTREDMELYLSQTFNENKLKEELKDPSTFFFVAELDNKLIGYTKLKEDYKHGIEVERLYVKREFQSQKIGAKLMSHSLDFSKVKQFKRIWLGVWEHNPNAIAFYEKFGFKIFGKHVFLLGKDPQNDLLMEKALLNDPL